ncbi:MAG TPA: sialidase family protein, partial [Armatimonadota bacterium]|nr:sialidase family protein [Armatimonadota bacterium]
MAIPAPPGCAIVSVNTAYAQEQGPVLIRHYGELFASDTISSQYEVRSGDNGATWSAPRPIHEQERTRNGTRLWGESCLFHDDACNRVLHLYNDQLYPAGTYTGEANRYTRIFMRVLDESGESFGEPVQLIQEGYDATHWARDTEYGRNSMMISFCAPVRTSEGRVLLPVALLPSTMDFSVKPVLGSHAGCFLGSWRGERLIWDLSSMITVDPKVSTAGLEEPTIAELVDGSLLMVCRAGNRNTPDVSVHKWRSSSTDGGLTWSPAEPLPYDTREPLFSFASGSVLIRH